MAVVVEVVIHDNSRCQSLLRLPNHGTSSGKVLFSRFAIRWLGTHANMQILFNSIGYHITLPLQISSSNPFFSTEFHDYCDDSRADPHTTLPLLEGLFLQ